MEVTVTFIGNATTLISGGGVTLLTDPNFLHRGQHAYLGYGLVSKRLREPAIDIDELPPLEAVVLSHMHGDHWDRRATTELDHELPVLTTPDAAKRLAHRGFGSALGLSTWQTHTIVKGDTVVNGRPCPAGTPPHRSTACCRR
jgi:L-ascorbate metabolism protein UlaG (beta-lactamase superfamily)